MSDLHVEAGRIPFITGLSLNIPPWGNCESGWAHFSVLTLPVPAGCSERTSTIHTGNLGTLKDPYRPQEGLQGRCRPPEGTQEPPQKGPSPAMGKRGSSCARSPHMPIFCYNTETLSPHHLKPLPSVPTSSISPRTLHHRSQSSPNFSDTLTLPTPPCGLSSLSPTLNPPGLRTAKPGRGSINQYFPVCYYFYSFLFIFM